MNEGNLFRMFLPTSAKALVMGKAQTEGGDAFAFLQEPPLPLQLASRKVSCSPSVIPDVRNRESILAFSSTLPKTSSHKNLKKTTHS